MRILLYFGPLRRTDFFHTQHNAKTGMSLSTIKAQMPTLDIKVLGVYATVLFLLYFSVAVYRNYRTIQSQKTEIALLQSQLRNVKQERSELEFIRDSLYAREPYFYINSLRNDWGFRKEGELLLSELPERSRICKGVPIYKISARRVRDVRQSSNTVFLLIAGCAISAIVFVVLFSVVSTKPRRTDPVAQIRSIFKSDSKDDNDQRPPDKQHSLVNIEGQSDTMPYA